MAFQIKANQPNFAGLSKLVEKSDPFSVMGKTMSQLDSLIDERQAQKYVGELDQATLTSPEALYGAMAKAPNKQAQDLLGDKFKNLANIQAMAFQKQKMEQDAAMAPLSLQKVQAEVEAIPLEKQQKAREAKIREQQLVNKQAEIDLEREKLGLDIQKKKTDIDVAKKERQAKATEAIGGVDRSIALAEEILANDQLDDIIGSIEGRTATFSEAESALEGKLDQLKDMIFMTSRDKLKGGGSITDFEGQKAAGMEINLDQTQDEESFRKNLMDFIKYKKQDRENAMKKYSDVFEVKDKEVEDTTDKPSIDSFFGGV